MHSEMLFYGFGVLTTQALEEGSMCVHSEMIFYGFGVLTTQA